MNANPHIWRGRVALAATVVIWSSPPAFQYWLAKAFDPWTQNFYRYASACLVIAPFVLWSQWRKPLRVSRSEWLGSAWAAIPNVVHQIAQTMAVVLLWPGLYALLGRISVIFTVVLAVIFFADERWVARSFKFLLGTALALGGVVGLVWTPPAADNASDSLSIAGLWLALFASIGWAAYGVLVKKFTARTGPTLGFGIVSFFTTLFLFPLMLVFGNGWTVFEVSWWDNFILFGSGIVCIGLGHWLYYIGIRDVGVSPSQSALLLCPLGTMMISSMLFGESFSLFQMLAGGVLLFGAFLALSARPATVEEPQ